MKAEICLVYKNEREAEAVTKAISPDNVEAPQGLFIKTVREGFKVITKMESNIKLQTLIATLDDLLACISVAEKTYKVLKK